MSSKSDAVLREEMGSTKPSRNAKPQRTTAATSTKAGDTETEAKTPRPRIAPGSKPSVVLQAHITDAEALQVATRLHKGEVEGDATIKGFAKAVDGLAKKIGEKAVNLVRQRHNPAGVQVYTRIALDTLIENGSITSKDLVEAYRANKYKDGTCRAQSNQIMGLFPALGIADRPDRGTLKLSKDSAIVADYKKAAKAAQKQAAAA